MVIVLMGVSGAGKTAVGRRLARELGWRFEDGDDYHPSANIEKMRRGVPLADEDRAEWLQRLRRLIAAHLRDNESLVIACSALRQAYRDYLSADNREIRFVYLKGDYPLIHARLKARAGHFMKEDLLASQFAALEEPEGALTVDAAAEPDAIVDAVKRAFGLNAA